MPLDRDFILYTLLDSRYSSVILYKSSTIREVNDQKSQFHTALKFHTALFFRISYLLNL